MIPAQALGLLAALLLAACSVGPSKVQGFRAKGPIYSNAVMDMASITGRWTQVATFASGGRPGCPAGGADIGSNPAGLTIATRLCLNGAEVSYAGPLAVTGPGRATPTGAVRAPLDREWWVLWADVDLRTLVIGTPDGSFGFILNRGGPLPQDRLKAAREILDWNGYDTSRLMTFR